MAAEIKKDHDLENRHFERLLDNCLETLEEEKYEMIEKVQIDSNLENKKILIDKIESECENKLKNRIDAHSIAKDSREEQRKHIFQSLLVRNIPYHGELLSSDDREKFNLEASRIAGMQSYRVLQAIIKVS